jgi:hypothetical protein
MIVLPTGDIKMHIITMYTIVVAVAGCIPFYIMWIFFKDYTNLQNALRQYQIIFCDICHEHNHYKKLLRVDSEDDDPIFLCPECYKDYIEL